MAQQFPLTPPSRHGNLALAPFWAESQVRLALSPKDVRPFNHVPNATEFQLQSSLLERRSSLSIIHIVAPIGDDHRSSVLQDGVRRLIAAQQTKIAELNVDYSLCTGHFSFDDDGDAIIFTATDLDPIGVRALRDRYLAAGWKRVAVEYHGALSVTLGI